MHESASGVTAPNHDELGRWRGFCRLEMKTTIAKGVTAAPDVTQPAITPALSEPPTPEAYSLEEASKAKGRRYCPGGRNGERHDADAVVKVTKFTADA
jgi:hypothetical protein